MIEDGREQIVELQTNLTAVTDQNARLASTLREARDHIIALKDEVERLAQPPAGFGIFLCTHHDGTADIFTGGRKLRVNSASTVDTECLSPGQEVMLNEALNIVEVLEFERAGDIATLKGLLPDGIRALVVGPTDDERVIRLAAPLRSIELHPGDSLLVEPRSGYAYEVVPKDSIPQGEIRGLLHDMPAQVEYEEIGGLDQQLEQIRRALELTRNQPELCRRMGLRTPRGILLYGPPGCGKTLIAKAVATALARPPAAGCGEDGARARFLSVAGPELLNKYVGETERTIRSIFQWARHTARDGVPVVVFFDEIDSLFQTRGTGVSSDVEKTVVPQLLAEFDGIRGLENVIVIGASNREDLIDPALLRPGRFDLKIRVDRPDRAAAHDIFAKHLTAELPLHPDALNAHEGSVAEAIQTMIRHVVTFLYSDADPNRFVEVTYQSGAKEVVYFRDFTSGAAIRTIVERAKWFAMDRHLAGTAAPLGIRVQDLIQAAKEEIRDTQRLMNTTNPDDWARISGARGERIVYVRTLGQAERGFASRSLEVERGNYGL